MWRDIRHAISYMPEEMKRYDLHIDNKAYNMGIFGGTDIDFIQRYTYKAFDFVDKKQTISYTMRTGELLIASVRIAI